MKKIEFPSLDGLLMSADYYEIENPKNIIVLCHRSHCNRSEYRETADVFNKMGYSCLAIDQRSGMKIFGTENETKNRAKAKKLPMGYWEAKPDVEAGINYAYTLNGNQPIMLLGSSYSAALSIVIAAESQKVAAMLLFSPGNYLKGIDLQTFLPNITVPTFATCAKKEIEETELILKSMKAEYLNFHKPKTEGFHGSKILWSSVKGYEEVWRQVELFLNALV